MVAESQADKEVSYIVVAVLRLQARTHRRSLLVPWVHTMRAKKKGDVLDDTEAILGEIAGIHLQGMPCDGRILRAQVDRGTERLDASFRGEMKKRILVHACTQG